MSQGAVQDSRLARTGPGRGDWDEEFDRGEGVMRGGAWQGGLGFPGGLRKWPGEAGAWLPGRSHVAGVQGLRPPVVCSAVSEVGVVGTPPEGHVGTNLFRSHVET